MGEKVVIRVEHLSSTKRENVWSFDWPCEDLLLSDKLCKAVEESIQLYLTYKFDRDRFYCKDKESIVHIQFGESISRFVHDNAVTLIYSEIVPPENAKNVGSCPAKNRDQTIYFDIYPREHNHRYSPHVNASCRGESIRITISDAPDYFGEERFTGNNRVNEKLALEYVRKHWKKLMEKWKVNICKRNTILILSHMILQIYHLENN